LLVIYAIIGSQVQLNMPVLRRKLIVRHRRRYITVGFFRPRPTVSICSASMAFHGSISNRLEKYELVQALGCVLHRSIGGRWPLISPRRLADGGDCMAGLGRHEPASSPACSSDRPSCGSPPCDCILEPFLLWFFDRDDVSRALSGGQRVYKYSARH